MEYGLIAGLISIGIIGALTAVSSAVQVNLYPMPPADIPLIAYLRDFL